MICILENGVLCLCEEMKDTIEYRKEDLMVVRVLIKRRFLKGKENEICSLLRDFRAGAMEMQGYISGETLVKKKDPLTLLVIGTWESAEDWFRWKENPNRKAFEGLMEVYQEGPTEYEEYTLGVPFVG